MLVTGPPPGLAGITGDLDEELPADGEGRPALILGGLSAAFSSVIDATLPAVPCARVAGTKCTAPTPG